MKNEKHHQWKGDEVGKSALHRWITRHYGSPNKCDDCGDTSLRKYEWANVSKKYKRDINDFKRLCTRCHRAFDKDSQARGERQGIAKLTEIQVKHIRRLWEFRNHTQREISQIFNVTVNAIKSITSRRNWRHVI